MSSNDQPTQNGSSSPSSKENSQNGESASAKVTPILPDAVIKLRRGQEGNEAVSKVLQKTMGVLQETEMEENLEEIKILDSQMDHLNSYLSKVEERVEKQNVKIREMLETQKTTQAEKRKSFAMRLQQSQAEDEDFQSQVALMLNRCAETRKTSVPANMMYEEVNGASGTS